MNPIIRRELLGILRTRWAWALQLGVAVGSILLVLVRWPTGDVTDLNGVRALQVLRIVGYGLLAGTILLVPAFPATSLVRERVQGTLALLFNTPLSPLAIYVGKLGGVLGFTATLFAMTLPAAAACYALGGAGAEGGILALYGILGVAVVQLATLALLVSSRAPSVDAALRTTYGLVLAVCVLTLAPHALLQGGSGLFTDAAAWLRCLSPIPAVMEVLGQGDVGSFGMSAGSGTVGRYVLLAPLAALTCALATVAGLNQRLLDRARPAGVMTQDRSTLGRLVRRLVFLLDPQRRSGSLPRWINPVMVKEFRSRRFGRSHWIVRLIALSAVMSLGVSYLAASGALGWGIDVIGGVLVLLQVALLVVFAPSLAAALISAERESGAWQLLRMTPLSGSAILRGKLMSVALPLLLLLGATLPGYIVISITRPALTAQVGRVVISLVLLALFAVLLSAAASTLFRATATATAVSYVGLIATCLGPLLVWLGRDAPFGHATVQASLLIDPVAAALEACAMPGFAPYELLPLSWWITGSACVVLLLVLFVRTWQLCRPE
jgi:ABC-type transport system involved in multi-copper enzyme maturation permease subunit